MQNEPHIVVPEWMTPKQVEAIGELYKTNPDKAVNQADFFKRVRPCIGGFCGLNLAWHVRRN